MGSSTYETDIYHFRIKVCASWLQEYYYVRLIIAQYDIFLGIHHTIYYSHLGQSMGMEKVETQGPQKWSPTLS